MWQKTLHPIHILVQLNQTWKKQHDNIWYTALLYIIYNSTLVQARMFNNVFLKAIFLLPKKKPK